ncbi:hypothetical protein PHISCL_01950 [Aspergillus sclerotialis]|uniref:Uncharacterized protein n=1 Tax=Aspergillus sclerotialis TaxID=2070753 RepID=A0A3A2ZWA4_9EURO|nr:hypothetical protein PHISCL_01950 [Aspergillus sclerotialis]
MASPMKERHQGYPPIQVPPENRVVCVSIPKDGPDAIFISPDPQSNDTYRVAGSYEPGRDPPFKPDPETVETVDGPSDVNTGPL